QWRSISLVSQQGFTNRAANDFDEQRLVQRTCWSIPAIDLVLAGPHIGCLLCQRLATRHSQIRLESVEDANGWRLFDIRKAHETNISQESMKSGTCSGPGSVISLASFSKDLRNFLNRVPIARSGRNAE